MRRKKAESAGTSGAGGRLTPMDVQQVEFRLAFRGYNERDVDAFLDRITEDLAAYIEENQRLRAGIPAPMPQPAVGDVTSARTEAERIVAEAREQASRIVRDAEARAVLAGAAASGRGASEGETRAAVGPFINRERAFLQSLGSLVQGHAEEIKQMVLALREKTEISAPAAAPEPGLTTKLATEPEAEPEAKREPEPAATTAEEAFAPIEVPAADESTEAKTGLRPDDVEAASPERAPAQLGSDSGERSLRELFWGED